MNLTLKIWRQNGPEDPGAMHEYQVRGISEESSFLEMLDVLNEELFARGEEPIAFDSDCREGICGQCGIVINGIAHGPEVTTTCQLHMRSFNDGDVITIEPWRAEAFPIIKDLVVNRSALDRIVQAGGYISVNTGAAPRCGPRVRSRCLHRLWRLRGCLPERLGNALHLGEGHSPAPAPAGQA